MGDGTVLHPITIDQAPLLARLHAESFKDGVWGQDQMQGSLELETTEGWAVTEKDDIIGFILCQMTDDAEILTFCVHPSRRRQGHGKRLVQKALRAAIDKKCLKMFLEVAEDNLPARNLYEKLGFTVQGRRPYYYPRDITPIDAIVFVQELTAPRFA